MRTLGSRPFALVAAAALLLGAGAACAPGSGPKPINLGAIYPVSGLQGPGGVDESRGALLAVERENQLGGVRGRAVRVRLVDVAAGHQAPAAMAKLRKHGATVVL